MPLRTLAGQERAPSQQIITTAHHSRRWMMGTVQRYSRAAHNICSDGRAFRSRR